MAILRHSCFPVEDGILHNTPALHHSSPPFKNHATAEPSLTDLALRTRFLNLNKGRYFLTSHDFLYNLYI